VLILSDFAQDSVVHGSGELVGSTWLQLEQGGSATPFPLKDLEVRGAILIPTAPTMPSAPTLPSERNTDQPFEKRIVPKRSRSDLSLFWNQ
jgi:hypothetical protein